MADGIKEIYDLDEPASGGSDKQAKDFKKDFKSRIKQPESDLEYLKSFAPSTAYGAMGGERDKVYGAYQKTLKAIDPQDSKKASGKIKQVLSDAGTLDTKTGKLRNDVEAGHAAWKSVEPKYDIAVGQVEEIDLWDLKGVSDLLASSGAVAEKVAARGWNEAKDKLGTLLKDVVAPYAEYQRQKEAKAQYDKDRAAFNKGLEELGNPPEPSGPMEAIQIAILGALPQFITLEVEKDYVTALDTLAPLAAQADDLTRMANDPDRATYLEGKPGHVELGENCAKIVDPYIKAKHADSVVNELQVMLAMAESGDYTSALKSMESVRTLGEECLAQAELNRQAKEAYQAARPDFVNRLAVAGTFPEPSKPMIDLLPTIQTKDKGAEDYAKEHWFIAGEPMLQEAITDLEKLEGLGFDPNRLAYMGAKPLAVGQAVAADLITDPFVEPLREPYRSAQTAMLGQAEAGNYGGAMASLDKLLAATEEFLSKAEENKQAKTAYEAQRGPFDSRLATATAYPEPSGPMIDLRATIDPVVTEMDGAVSRNDFIEAVDVLAKADKSLVELEGLGTDPNRIGYLAAKPLVLTRKAEADQAGAPWMEALKTPYGQHLGEMEKAATGGDYKSALGQMQAAETALNDFMATVEENTEAQGLYGSERTEFDGRHGGTQSYPEPSDPMKVLATEVLGALQPADSAASAMNFIEALPALRVAAEVLGKLEAAGMDPNRLAYFAVRDVAGAAITAADAIDNPSLQALKEPFAGAHAKMETAAKAGDYVSALGQANAAEAAAGLFMDEAQKDIEAEKIYRPDRDAITGDIAAIMAQPDPDEPMVAGAAQVNGFLDAAQGIADQGDFDQAVAALGPARGALDALRGLSQDPGRLAYLASKPAIENAIAMAKAADAAVGGRLSAVLLTTDPSAMEAAAKAGNYGEAQNQMAEIQGAVDETMRLSALFERYDGDRVKLLERIQDAEAAPEPSDPMVAFIAEAKGSLAQGDTKADSGDIEDALAALDLGHAALDRFVEALKDPMRLLYLGKIPHFQPPFVPLGPVVRGDSTPTPAALLVSYQAITEEAQAGRYGAAVNKLATLQEDIDSYTAAVAANAAAKAAYDNERPPLDQSLSQLAGQPVPSDPMSALVDRIKGQLATAAAFVGEENFIAAQESLSGPKQSLTELEALANDPDRLAFIGLQPVVASLLVEAAAINDPFMAEGKVALSGMGEAATSAAKAGDYKAAVQQLSEANQAVMDFLAAAETNRLAKAEYDKERVSFDARHGQAKAFVEPSNPMQEMAAKVEAGLGQVGEAAKSHDFELARQHLAELGMALSDLETAGNDPDRIAYLIAKPVTLGLITQAETIDNPSLAGMKANFASAAQDTASAAAAGDYKGAMAALNAAGVAVADFMKEAQRDLDAEAAYKQELGAFEGGLDAVKKAPHPSDPITEMIEELEGLLPEAEKVAGTGDFSAAQEQLHALQPKLQTLQAKADDPKRLGFLKAVDDLEKSIDKNTS